MRAAFAVVLICVLLSPFLAEGRGSGAPGRRPSTMRRSLQTRDKLKEKFHRSAAARRAFMREHPCPSTGKVSGPCPGYVVDHIQPLKRGGADNPANMQWQSKAAASAKDRFE